MHSVSPYTIRCFNNKLSGENKYCVLNKIGSKDVFVLLNDFIQSKTSTLSIYDKTKQAYFFSDVTFDQINRRLSGWMKIGEYGLASDILNIKTGAKAFSKTEDNAEMIMHYFQFYIPIGYNEGLCIFHSYRGRGIKTIFSDIFMPEFLKNTSLNLQGTSKNRYP
jgi:hypothetical protein